jgi:hypothetical protein
MIEVRCSNCDHVFEAESSAAGLSEFCPACGALTDVPAPDPDEEEFLEPWEAAAPAAPLPPSAVAPVQRASPRILGWVLELAALAILIWIGWLLFSGNWESRHLQFLSDTINRADSLLSAGDLPGAQREYGRVLQTVGTRSLESLYLRDVLARARRGLQTVQMRQATVVAATSPTTQPSIAPNLNQAIKSFQRASEGFADFVRRRPMVFQDIHGSWRRRQFVVWDVNYQIQSDADPPRIELRYTCNPRLTAPHTNRQDALADEQFLYDERTAPLARRTSFVFHDGQWVITPAPSSPTEDGSSIIRDGNLRPDDPSIAAGLGVLELQAFVLR